jgi:hypothetical protein
MKDMRHLMQQAKQMQEKMKQAQDEIQSIQVEGESGAGIVRVSMNGRHNVSKVTIDPELRSEDTELLEDLVVAAFNDAVQKIEAETKEKMGNVTGGMHIPPGLNF